MHDGGAAQQQFYALVAFKGTSIEQDGTVPNLELLAQAQRISGIGRRQRLVNGNILDHVDRRMGRETPDGLLQVGADSDHRVCPAHDKLLDGLDGTNEERAFRKSKVGHLLREIGVHIIDMLQAGAAKEKGQGYAHQARLFMRMQIAIASEARAQESPESCQKQQHIQRKLGKRWPYLHFANERQRWRSIDMQSGQGYLFSNRIRHKVYFIAQGE